MISCGWKWFYTQDADSVTRHAKENTGLVTGLNRALPSCERRGRIHGAQALAAGVSGFVLGARLLLQDQAEVEAGGGGGAGLRAGFEQELAALRGILSQTCVGAACNCLL